MLPIVLPYSIVEEIFQQISHDKTYLVTIDLEGRYVELDKGERHSFEIDDFRRDCLLKGLDDIGITLTHSDSIKKFEAEQKNRQPWLY